MQVLRKRPSPTSSVLETTPKEFIKVIDLGLSYGTIPVIENLTFSIIEGEIIALLGPSGCGKTSLLNILSGIFPPSEGDVQLKSQSILSSSKHCSYMFQDDLLLPWRNIYDNVLLSQQIGPDKVQINKEHAKQLLNDFGLSDSLKLYPNQVSGGMKRRASFVRTLSISRELYLFDEPTSGLDYLLRLKLEEKLLKFLITQKKTAIIVTHDIETAISIADRILILKEKPSNIKKSVDAAIGRKYSSSSKARESSEFATLFQQVLRAYKGSDESN